MRMKRIEMRKLGQLLNNKKNQKKKKKREESRGILRDLNQKLARSYMFMYCFLWAGHFFPYTTFISLLFPVICPQ